MFLPHHQRQHVQAHPAAPWYPAGHPWSPGHGSWAWGCALTCHSRHNLPPPARLSTPYTHLVLISTLKKLLIFIYPHPPQCSPFLLSDSPPFYSAFIRTGPFFRLDFITNYSYLNEVTCAKFISIIAISVSSNGLPHSKLSANASQISENTQSPRQHLLHWNMNCEFCPRSELHKL